MTRWVPWYAKIVAKVVLSRLRLRHGFWRRLNLFMHGFMHDPKYAHRVYREHFDRSPLARKRGGFVALEVGPGDSVLSAVVAKAYGAHACYLIDSGAYAIEDMALYRAGEDYLRALNLSPPDLSEVANVKEVLAKCNAVYKTEGLNSVRGIPSDSVDFVWSEAVLEHIRRHEFLDFMRELRRVLRPDGICSHHVDLKDHLGGALNNLRFSPRRWESDWMANSGFYTNRIRYREMIDLFGKAGFRVEVLDVDRWHSLPTPRRALHISFRSLPDEDLLISGFHVLLRPA
jgi:SAM-dependent methyltransferase